MKTFGSLFTGIGGFDLGLERVGWRCLWQGENDAACNSVLERHWPDVKRYGDIKEMGVGELETVDLICGGWPCQDLSIAGKRGGLAGEQSGLFFEAVRIIQGLQPRWFILENVLGLFSQNEGEDFAAVVKALTQCGYGVAWRVLDSQYFGVAQRRRRVFIVGSLGDASCAKVLFESESSPRDTPSGREEGSGVTAPLKASPPSRRGGGSSPIADEFIVMRNREGCEGGGKGPMLGDKSFTLAQNNDQIAFIVSRDAVPKTANGLVTDLRAGNPHPSVIAFNWQGGSDVRLSFGKPNLQASQVPAIGVRRLTPTECERLQGFPDGWTEGQADSARYRQLGNAVTVNVIEWLGRRILYLDSAQFPI